MNKNAIIAVLVLLIVGETGYILAKKAKTEVQEKMPLVSVSPTPQAGPNARGGRQMIVSKGTNLKESPLFQYVHEIVPTMSDDAKKAITGFTVVSKTQADGSTVVTLTPKDSDDQDQQYTIKSGQVLYFVEQTPADDKNDMDKDLNYRDDYGIITDANGIVQ